MCASGSTPCVVSNSSDSLDIYTFGNMVGRSGSNFLYTAASGPRRQSVSFVQIPFYDT